MLYTIGALALALPTAHEWVGWKAAHGKTYATVEEESQRLKIWEANKARRESASRD